MGICPPGTRLAPPDPLIRPWRDLSDRERALFARQMEVYAAYVSFVDHHLGQLVALLEELGQLDNTLIIVTSDNGASIEGGAEGLPNEVLFFNNVPVTFDQIDASRDDWGGPETFPAFAAGWAFAGNTPFRRWKRDTTRGGTAEPFIVHWPGGIRARGEVRTQFTHAVDVVPTVLDVLDMGMPASQEFTVRSSRELAAGEHTLRFEFERTGPPNFAQGRGAPGVGRLFIDGQQVGEMDIPVTVPISFALSGEGLCCGWDSLSPAVSAYQGEFPFTGTIRRVTIDIEPAVAAPPPDTAAID
jgi:hypothetical protein